MAATDNAALVDRRGRSRRLGPYVFCNPAGAAEDAREKADQKSLRRTTEQPVSVRRPWEIMALRWLSIRSWARHTQ